MINLRGARKKDALKSVRVSSAPSGFGNGISAWDLRVYLHLPFLSVRRVTFGTRKTTPENLGGIFMYPFFFFIQLVRSSQRVSI